MPCRSWIAPGPVHLGASEATALHCMRIVRPDRPGYAEPVEEVVTLLARTEGMLLGPTYAGHAMAGRCGGGIGPRRSVHVRSYSFGFCLDMTWM